jgi:hypothetical protein
MERWRRLSPICRRSSETSKLELAMDTEEEREVRWCVTFLTGPNRLEGARGSGSSVGAVRVASEMARKGHT